MNRVDEDRLAAAAVGELEHVVLAPPARERLVAKNVPLVDDQSPMRQEEPLPLPDGGGVPAPEPVPRPHPRDRLTHRFRLQRVLRRRDAGDAPRRLRDRRDEPVPLVEPTQELALLAALAHEQKQAAIVPVCLDDVERDPTATCQAELEELAPAVRADV